MAGILNDTLSHEARKYFDLLDTMNQNGLGQQIPTPKCVVIGDQSSGKSSTLENLCGLELPKGKKNNQFVLPNVALLQKCFSIK